MAWFESQQGNLRLSGPPSGQGAGGGARTRDGRVVAELRADSLSTVPPTRLVRSENVDPANDFGIRGEDVILNTSNSQARPLNHCNNFPLKYVMKDRDGGRPIDS
ncbi:hypothetical protein PoB_002382400 [Plakobranchus ocellatus]|uniref:Uncharacterized protein n=1 Tax=Plakobranchus ocellatus TaxID=259542 RepID=A0AAV3ZPS0_9GAST|nr:hypothetical protein PoB_002382400 [Plakobranchus ocellatus]